MVSVVISALNEESRLADTVETAIRAGVESKKMPLDIIIVNDGSTDGTAEVIKSLEAKYDCVRSIHFKKNQGIGTGILAAMEIAKFDKMCNFPGDNACSPYIMKSLFSNSDKADFLISFLVNSENRGYFRRVVSAMYSFIYFLTFDIPIRYVNGAQLYSIDIVKKMNLGSRRYGLLAEICIKMLRKDITFLEIADYVRPNQTKSSAIKIHNLIEVFKTFGRLVWEIHFKNRREYQGNPIRIIPNPDLAAWVIGSERTKIQLRQQPELPSHHSVNEKIIHEKGIS